VVLERHGRHGAECSHYERAVGGGARLQQEQGARDDSVAAGNADATEGVYDGQGVHLTLEQRQQSTGSRIILRGEACHRLQHLFNDGGGHSVAERNFNYLR
jgi:hypothetical protein